LKRRTSYDVLPLSFRLIVLDNDLLIKKSLNILIQNGTRDLTTAAVLARILIVRLRQGLYLRRYGTPTRPGSPVS
jgi:hypothetical protein